MDDLDMFDEPSGAGKSKDKSKDKRKDKPAADLSKAPKRVKRAVDPNKTKVVRSPAARLKQEQLWLPENRSSVISGIRAGLLRATQEKFGVSRVFGDVKKMSKLIVGIPIPSLAFEWLIDSQVLPLRSMMMLVGTWSTNKSSLLYELMRWFIELDGFATLIDTENKFDPRLADSVMQNRGRERYIYTRAGSTQEAQASLTFQIKQAEKAMIGTSAEPGPGLIVPCIFGLDSLAAATAQENIDKMLTSGHATRQHPVNALLNKYFTQNIRPMMAAYPMLFVVVNHLKVKRDERTEQEVEYTLGGSDQNFMEALEIKSAVWKQGFTTANFSGIGIRLRTTKNSFGQRHRSIRTRFLWWEEVDPDTGDMRRQHIWDWNWSIVALLSEAEGPMKAALKAHDLKIAVRSEKADVGCLANMPALGMGKDEMLPWQEVGQMIHDNLEVRNRIRKALNIQAGTVLDEPLDVLEELHLGKRSKR